MSLGTASRPDDVVQPGMNDDAPVVATLAAAQALSFDPGDAVALKMQARILLNSGNRKAALLLLRSVLDRNAADKDALQMIEQGLALTAASPATNGYVGGDHNGHFNEQPRQKPCPCRVKIHVVETIEEFKRHFGLQRDGVLLETGLDEVETDCDVDSRKRRDAEVLCTLAANASASVLELGTSHGRGAYKLATNLPPGLTVYTVNLLPEQYDTSGGKLITHLMPRDMIGAYFREHNVANVEQIYANTARWEIPAHLGDLGIVFIDAAHDEALVASDTRLVWPRVEDNGFIVWHDFAPFLRQRHDWIDASMRGVERFLKEHGMEDAEVVYLRNSWCGVLRKMPVAISVTSEVSITEGQSEPLPKGQGTIQPNFRYAVVYPAYSPARIEEEQRGAAEARKLGFDVEALPITCPGGWWQFPKLDEHWRKRSPELMRQYDALEERLRGKDVLIASGGAMLHPEFVRRLATFNVWICDDDPESSEVLSRPAAPAFDYCFPINVACVDDYKRWGCKRVDWIFHPIRDEMRATDLSEEAILTGQRDLDVVMLCERVLGLSDRAQRLEKLAAVFPQACLRGEGWPGGHISGAAVLDVYSRARIGWNLHNSIGPCNTRLVTLPAFGVMQICDNKSHLGKVFELDREVVGFDSIEECIEKTRYYLEHDDERRLIAVAGWKRAMRDYTWPKWWEWLETRISPHAQAKLAASRQAMSSRLDSGSWTIGTARPAQEISALAPASTVDVSAEHKSENLDVPVLAPDGDKPRVLMLVDRRGWAYDTAAQAISKRLADEFEFRIEYVREQPDLNAWPFDLIYVFFWGETYHQKFVKDPSRVIKEISSHRWANEEQYGRLTAEQTAERYLADAGTLTVTSHRLRDLFAPYREMHWCPNGFEPANFQAPRERSGPLRIGWAGNENDPCKGLKDVLKPAAGEDFELVIAGGDLGAAQMAQAYKQIDVLCVASTAEGEPLTLVEGMASGCFPVAVDVGIVPELVQHGRNGLTVNRTSAAFQSAFQWCRLNVADVRRAGAENARTMLGTRRWDDVAIHWRRALRSAYRRYSASGTAKSVNGSRGLAANGNSQAFFERNLGVQLGQWPERAKAAADLLARCGLGVGASVIDLGCGHQTLKGLLPPGVQYVPVDRITRTPGVMVFDLNDRLPEGDFTAAALLGVIEYFDRPERLLAWAAEHTRYLVLSYNDCSNPARREKQHWRSTLNFDGLEAVVAKLGGQIAEKHDLGRAEFIYSISFAERPLKKLKKLALFSAAVNGDNSGDALIVDAIQRLLSPHAAEIFPLLEPLTGGQIEAVNACDIAVICGTNLYQQEFSCALTPGIIEKIRVPILPLGIGTSAPIGQLPKMSPEGVRAVRMIHERSPLGSVRDPISLQFVRSLGISNVELTGCPVLFHALKEPVFKTTSTDRLVVAVRARLLHVEEHWGAKQLKTLERLCREFRPTLVLQSPYDLPVAEELRARFHVQVLHDPHYAAKPMLDGVLRATRTIGLRLHFGMLTLAHGKPATLIATDTRTSEFCDMMGVPWHDIHSYTDDELIKELREPQPGREKFVAQWRHLREAMIGVFKAGGLDTALK
jgi:spore maturation protein CgeB